MKVQGICCAGVLAQNDRLAELPAIADTFDDIMAAVRGEVKATVTTAEVSCKLGTQGDEQQLSTVKTAAACGRDQQQSCTGPRGSTPVQQPFHLPAHADC